jgi:carboxypeptidase Taq
MQLIEEYKKLRELVEETSLLSSTASVLSWDQSTHLPPRAAAYRARQCANLEGMVHKMFTASKVGDWLKACEDAGLADRTTVDEPEIATQIISTNVRELRRAYDLATKVPERLVKDLAQTTGEAYSVWVEARKASDFSQFSHWLEKLITLKREEADCLGYKECRYDALLDQYEVGATTSQLKPLFGQLQELVRVLVPELLEVTKGATPPPGPFPQAAQEAFNDIVARAVGYDMNSGRIDTTVHPFCTCLGPWDHRITTRYDEADFMGSFFGILHESGHALYNQGLLKDEFGMPAGQSVSLGIHESQSRLWENQVGRSREFWDYWYPLAVQHFPSLAGYSKEQLWLWANRVKPSFIRVEADEVTYHLHVALRFEIEQRLINGGLEAKDAPEFWNESFKHLMGIAVPDDAHGCLQDVHWSVGLFGYFPTYSLGSMNAAQLYTKAQDKVPAIATEMAQGKYEALLQWLRTNIHEPGKRFTPQELMIRATGEPTNPKYYVDYMKTKFGLK